MLTSRPCLCSSRDTLPAGSSLFPVSFRLLALAAFVLAALPGFALPLLQDTFDSFDIRTKPPGLNTMSWEIRNGETVREYLDGPAVGLMAGAEILSVQSVPVEEYTFVSSVTCRFGDPAKLVFAWQDEKNFCYIGISSIPTGSKTHLGLFMILNGKEEKLTENRIFPLPYGATVTGRFSIHVKNDGSKFVVEADREGNGVPYEVRAEVTRKEAVDKFHGGRVGIFNCYTGTPRSRTWLIYDTVSVELGRVDADPLRGALTLFVDGAAGKDENPGTKDQPVKTIRKALAFSQPGDEVVVRAGKYPEKLLFPDAKAYGTSERRLAIRGEEPLKATISGIDTKNADYLKIDGFEVVDEGAMISGKGTELKNCFIHDIPGKNAIWVTGENHAISGNHVKRASFGIVVFGKNNRVEGNDIEQLVFVTGDCDYIRFFGEGHVFTHNYLHGTRKEEVANSHIDGFQTFSVNPEQTARNILIEGNIVSGFYLQGVIMTGQAEVEDRPSSVDSIIVRNNVFADARIGISAAGVTNLQVVNNTFIVTQSLGAGLTLMTQAGTRTTGVVRNNILCNGSAILPPRPSPEMLQNPWLTVEGNLFYHSSRQYTDTWPRNVLNKEPMLVDPANPVGADGKPFTADDGYQLRPGSPCVDAGVRIEDAAASKDILGALRPQGSGWDIGAVEFAPR